MDRFEVADEADSKSVAEIYIPVWIDLKLMPTWCEPPTEFNLHSSMDRFEGFGSSRNSLNISRFTFQYG